MAIPGRLGGEDIRMPPSAAPDNRIEAVDELYGRAESDRIGHGITQFGQL
jgi:hypothetical protein